MADVLEDTVNLLELALIGLIVYGAYKIYSEAKTLGSQPCNGGSLLDMVTGCASKPGAANQNQPSAVPGNATIAQSIGGYEGFGANGVYYSCTGPSGSTSDMCTPMNCDLTSGNCTLSGTAIPASQAGF